MIDVFTPHIPPTAVPYCYQLKQQYPFVGRVAKPRRTRLGDFRVFPTGQTQITVNADLNPYAFLITYIHEIAHADVQQQYSQLWPDRKGPYWQPHRRPALSGLRRAGRNGPVRVLPHGQEWQATFRRLMEPLLNESVFPASILIPLRQYLTKPAATTYAHPALMLALRQADTKLPVAASANRMVLREVQEGNLFLFNKKTFVRGTLRRTRIVCKEVASGKLYAILAHTWVELGEK